VELSNPDMSGLGITSESAYMDGWGLILFTYLISFSSVLFKNQGEFNVELNFFKEKLEGWHWCQKYELWVPQRKGPPECRIS